MFKTTSFASSKKSYNPSFDMLRGLLCIVVYLYHSTLIQGSIAKPFFRDAAMMALPLFFIFSSTLLVASNFRPNGFTYVDTLRFYLNRFFRIFPAWWCFLAVSFFFYRPEFKFLLANMVMIFGFFPIDQNFNYTIIGWSLFAEEFYYWFFPLWIKLIRNLKSACFAALFAFLVFLIWFSYGQENPIESNPYWYKRFPLNWMHIFILGFVVFFLKENASVILSLKNKRTVRILDLALIVALLLTPNTIFYFIPLVLIMLLVQCETSIVYKLLNGALRGVFQDIGVACFSFYLFHVLLIGLTCRVSFLMENLWLKVVVDLFLSWMIAKISYGFIEKPSQVLGHKVLTRIFRSRERLGLRS